MQTFLSEVAQQLRSEHPDNLADAVVVFNNRRSGLFLRRQFASMNSDAFFLPRIIGIDELISELGGFSIVSNEYLLFELFDIHRHLHEKDDTLSSFEDFIAFGDMMLADFSEIDLYRVDAKQLFNNLHDLKAIGEWDIETGRLSPFQEKYLAFYCSLYKYYSLLHDRLLQQRRAYSGMAYRFVAENIETLVPAQQDGHYYYFVGFNAISACEEAIIRHYIRNGNGKIIADGDAYYFNDPNNEAGHFLRKHLQNQLLCPTSFPEHFALEQKDITIVSCPENLLQCKYAGHLLAQQSPNRTSDTNEQTAIVLADESLLIPMLNALPGPIHTANVTMGYPLTSTSLHALLLDIFALHQHRKSQMFYHQDILDLLSNKYLIGVHGAKDAHSLLSNIFATQNIIYVDFDELNSLCQQIGIVLTPIGFLFTSDSPTPDSLLNQLTELIRLLYSSECISSNTKEKASLASMFQIIDYLKELQSQYHFIDNLNVLLKIYTRLAQRNSVSFYGEPLQGLQILGMLETRNLDFKKVIFLSANEGIMPSGRTPNTLIPYNLKTAFGIPTYREKDAVYAYNFYRLIQRANEIHFIYYTESENIGKGEPSRFLLQIRRELTQRYPDSINLSEKVLSVDSLKSIEPGGLSYQKEPYAILRLQKISQHGLSPSALNKYRSCPLKFYYENILNINERDSVNEDLEQNELGSCIHKVLEKIYAPTIGIPLQVTHLSHALDNIDTMLAQVFDEQFRHGRNQTGRNHFLKSVARTQITNFLKSEISDLKKGHSISIISLEKRLSHNLQIFVNDIPQQVTISGIADRIDTWDNLVRIVDYKSGKVVPRDLVVKEAHPNWANTSDKWFQVLVYTWLSHQTIHSQQPYLSGIQPLGHLQSEFLAAQWGEASLLTPLHLESFETMLKNLLSDLLNPDIPFTPNKGIKMCSYCPFAETCNRPPSDNSHSNSI